MKNRNISFTIPADELESYQKGILRLLSKVELDRCDETLKEDLKSIFRLLNHLVIK